MIKILIKMITILLLSLCSIDNTSSYFTTNSKIENNFETRDYLVSLDGNGGTFKSSNITVIKDSITLPTPKRDGYTFNGWTDNKGNNITNSNVKYNGQINYTANWNINSYIVDINPIIEGIEYKNGLDGFTFDVYINDILVADDVKDWCQQVNYNSKLRVVANNVVGYSTSYDKTITIGSNNIDISPIWGQNVYEAHFYLDGIHKLTTYNKYGSYITTPNVLASSLGYNDNFYHISGYTPWTTWYQPDHEVGFTINISEYNCKASFGAAGISNSQYQLNRLISAGYNFCSIDYDWGPVVCIGNYSKVIDVYNNAWNILPRSGNGFSIYKQFECDSGYSTYERR